GDPITCRIDLDLNGILKVTAREKVTGLEKHIVIDNAISRFENEEMAAASERLRRMFGDAEESHNLRVALTSAQAEARGSLEEVTSEEDGGKTRIRARVERARNRLSDVAQEDQDELAGLIERVHGALQNDELDEADEATQELEDILFYLEEV
ncbi:MAG: Hsp70 family protein, partial [Phycisphaerae bacterium]